MDNQDDTRSLLIDIQESQRRFEKRQRNIRVGVWIAAVCGLIVCLIAMAEFSLLVFVFMHG